MQPSISVTEKIIQVECLQCKTKEQRMESVLINSWNLIKQRHCKRTVVMLSSQITQDGVLWGHIVGYTLTFYCRYYLRGSAAVGERLVLGFIWIHQKAGFGRKCRGENQLACLGQSREPIVSTFICSWTAERVLYCCRRGGAIHLHWFSYGRAALWISKGASAWKCQWNSVGPRNYLGVTAAASAKTPFPTPLFKICIFSVHVKGSWFSKI